jgi:lambda family phage minor tail protein L
MNDPVEQIEDALKLTGDREVSLWEITLRDGSKAFLRNGPNCTWQGNDYEGLPIMMTGEEDTADDQNARPSLRVFNPKKIFGPWAHEGRFELATVIRRRVLQTHLLNNSNIFKKRVWVIGQIQSCTSRSLDVQLRSPIDTPNLNTPTRVYAPPDFPTIRF